MRKRGRCLQSRAVARSHRRYAAQRGLKAGAEFIVIITGKIMTMPGLPKVPAAESIDVDNNGNIVGIF